MGELLGALGLAWPRLLLYPGGIFALGASWLLARWLRWCTGQPPLSLPPLTLSDRINVLPPLIVLTLLPLAPAANFPYGIDLVVAVSLLEWPQLCATNQPPPERGALVRRYGLLILAGLGMLEGAGSMTLSDLVMWPTAWPARVLLLGGAGLWLAALPRLLADPATQRPAGQCRALGLLLLGTLPLSGALTAWANAALPTTLTGWLIPPIAYLGAALVLGGVLRLRQAKA